MSHRRLPVPWLIIIALAIISLRTASEVDTLFALIIAHLLLVITVFLITLLIIALLLIRHFRHTSQPPEST